MQTFKHMYKGWTIHEDRDEDGNKAVYIQSPRGGEDPIEVDGASLYRAKQIIDQCELDMAEAHAEDWDRADQSISSDPLYGQRADSADLGEA